MTSDVEILNEIVRDHPEIKRGIRDIKCAENEKHYWNIKDVPADCVVEEVDISEVNKPIEGLELSKLKQLKFLSANFNWNESVPEFVNDLTNLKTLNLSYNYIKEIRNIDKLRKLKYLWLGNNLITEVKGISDPTHELESVHLGDNPVAFKYGFLKSDDEWIRGSPWEQNWIDLRDKFHSWVKFSFEPESWCDGESTDVPNWLTEYATEYTAMCDAYHIMRSADPNDEESRRLAQERVKSRLSKVVKKLGAGAEKKLGVTLADIGLASPSADYELLQSISKEYPNFGYGENSVQCVGKRKRDLGYNPAEVPKDCVVESIRLDGAWGESPQDVDAYALDRFPNLKSLTITYNEMKQIPKGINKIKSLEMLGIGGTSSVSKVENIDELKKLRDLDLGWSGINNMRDLEWLEKYPNLRSVGLGDNPASFKYGAMKSGSPWIKGSPWEQNWRELERKYPNVKFDFAPEEYCWDDAEDLTDHHGVSESDAEMAIAMCEIDQLRRSVDDLRKQKRETTADKATIDKAVEEARAGINSQLARVIAKIGEEASKGLGISFGKSPMEGATIAEATTKKEKCDLLLVSASDLACEWLDQLKPKKED